MAALRDVVERGIEGQEVGHDLLKHLRNRGAPIELLKSVGLKLGEFRHPALLKLLADVLDQLQVLRVRVLVRRLPVGHKIHKSLVVLLNRLAYNHIRPFDDFLKLG